MWQRQLLAAFLLGIAVAPAHAIEPWADTDLSVTAGLQLWLDASRQNAARRAQKLSELADGHAVETAHDASGLARHLQQKDASLRPIFVKRDRYIALRFDGDHQHLT